jgi:hypothetical protein
VKAYQRKGGRRAKPARWPVWQSSIFNAALSVPQRPVETRRIALHVRHGRRPAAAAGWRAAQAPSRSSGHWKEALPFKQGGAAAPRSMSDASPVGAREESGEGARRRARADRALGARIARRRSASPPPSRPASPAVLESPPPPRLVGQARSARRNAYFSRRGTALAEPAAPHPGSGDVGQPRSSKPNRAKDYVRSEVH